MPRDHDTAIPSRTRSQKLGQLLHERDVCEDRVPEGRIADGRNPPASRRRSALHIAGRRHASVAYAEGRSDNGRA
jgi:hypothetical protein